LGGRAVKNRGTHYTVGGKGGGKHTDFLFPPKILLFESREERRGMTIDFMIVPTTTGGEGFLKKEGGGFVFFI